MGKTIIGAKINRSTLSENQIKFYLNGHEEVIKILPNGEFYYYGNLVTEDIEIYNAFVKFLTGAGCYKKGMGND